MRKTTVIIIAILVVSALMVGCGSDKPIDRTTDEHLPPDEQDNGAADSLMVPQINGIIKEINEDGPILLLVDSQSQAEGQVTGDIWVAITDDTDFFEDVSEDSSLGVSNVSRDFKVGNRVSIYTDVIMESYPMQAEAIAVYENTPE